MNFQKFLALFNCLIAFIGVIIMLTRGEGIFAGILLIVYFQNYHFFVTYKEDE